MKTFAKILIILIVLLGILAGVSYFAYRSIPKVKEAVLSILAQSTDEKDLEHAYVEFLKSCQESLKKKMGSLDAVQEEKINNYCLCAQGEFKKRFSPKEIIAIGLQEMTIGTPTIDPKKIQEIVSACQSQL